MLAEIGEHVTKLNLSAVMMDSPTLAIKRMSKSSAFKFAKGLQNVHGRDGHEHVLLMKARESQLWWHPRGLECLNCWRKENCVVDPITEAITMSG